MSYMNILEPKQTVDMIAVRLFTRPENELVTMIHPLAIVWARKRHLDVFNIKNRHGKHEIRSVLPEYIKPYNNWNLISFIDETIQDIFSNQLDLIRDVGWYSARKFMRPWTKDEKIWLISNIPNCEWLFKEA